MAPVEKNRVSREKFRRFCGTAGTTASRLNFRAAGDLFSRVSAKKFFGCFFVVFCCFCCFLGVFSCFWVFFFVFRALARNFFLGLFFAVPQGIPAISPLPGVNFFIGAFLFRGCLKATGARIWSWRRRWREESQYPDWDEHPYGAFVPINPALLRFAELTGLSGKLTFHPHWSRCRAPVPTIRYAHRVTSECMV